MTDEARDESTRLKRSLAFWLGTLPGRVLAFLSCATLFMMMALTFVDVAGRYLFNSPLPALYEIISFMMPVLIFCVLPLVCYREGHVTIDLFDALVPRRLKRAQGFVVNLVGAAAMVFIAWRLYARSASHREFGEVTDELYIVLWPFSLGMAILTAVAAVALLAAALGYLTGARRDPAAQTTEAYE